MAAGGYVTIAYRLREEAADRQETIDALELAFAAWDAWREFMVRDGIAAPTGRREDTWTSEPIA